MPKQFRYQECCSQFDIAHQNAFFRISNIIYPNIFYSKHVVVCSSITWFAFFPLQILVTSNNGSNSKMYSIDDPWATKSIIRLQSLLLQKSPMVKVAAFNSFGSGPFSESIPIVFDPLKDPLYYNEHFELGSSLGVGAQYTWLIALLGKISCHSSEIRDLCLMKCSSKTL